MRAEKGPAADAAGLRLRAAGSLPPFSLYQNGGADGIACGDGHKGELRPQDAVIVEDKGETYNKKHNPQKSEYHGGLPVVGAFVHGLTRLSGGVETGVIEKGTPLHKVEDGEQKQDAGEQKDENG